MYGGEQGREPDESGIHAQSSGEPSQKAITWVFDTVHSSIHFSVRRMVIGRVRGQFCKWRGSMVYDESVPREAHVAVRIDADSIETNDARRDAHLRSADFLDVAQFPHITFASSRVEANGEQLTITGLLGIRGVTREVVLESERRGKVRDRWDNERLGFSARTTIPRHAFGLTWNEVMPTGELYVGEEIEISIEIEAMRSPTGGG
jgi:polyisoprenoid-binding protein YceI